MDRFFNRHGWRKHMRNQGFRITMPREMVLDILNDADKHLSAKEIYSRILQIDSRIGLTTVYRVLDMLVNMNFVNQVNIGDNTMRYEIKNKKNSSHIHIICEDSETLIDYNLSEEEIDLLNKLKDNIEKKHNIKIMNHNIQFLGKCNQTNEHKE